MIERVGMGFFLGIAGLGFLFLMLDGEVSRRNSIREAILRINGWAPDHDSNDGYLIWAYLIVGGFLILGLALIALMLFSYPLWQGKF